MTAPKSIPITEKNMRKYTIASVNGISFESDHIVDSASHDHKTGHAGQKSYKKRNIVINRSGYDYKTQTREELQHFTHSVSYIFRIY